MRVIMILSSTKFRVAVLVHTKVAFRYQLARDIVFWLEPETLLFGVSKKMSLCLAASL